MSTAIDFFPTEYASSQNNNTAVESPFMSQGNTKMSGGSFDYGSAGQTGFEEEQPLWEELGFDPELIKSKTLALLIPPQSGVTETILADNDLGGPFCFCILLGLSLLLQGGKLHFGYIFGYSITGGGITYLLLNLMSERGIGLSHTMSVLGYCLPPMILLALAAIIFPPTGIIGFVIGSSIICYCTYSASSMLVRVLNSVDQRALIAFPVGLLYTCFALIVMF